MITQAINLNLIPGQVLPRVNVSQYDSGTRTLRMTLFNGEQIFNVPSGASGYIQGTKPDRTGFQYAATVTAGSNIVTIDITQQMTAVKGEVVCELVLANGSDRIATVNFIIYVEPAALADDTVISETDLPLIEQAAELAQEIEAIADQVAADAQTASDAAQRAEEWASDSPYIGANGHWFVYDTTLGQFVDTNINATGPQGATGPTGPQGPQGDAATIAVGTVQTLPAGSSATVTNSGTSEAAVFNFGIPKGQDGTGSGDMSKADYDANGAVELAGGIASYVSTAISGKANTADLGTAAYKDSTNAVTSGSTDLVESGAVASELATVNSSITTLTNQAQNKVLYFTGVACAATTGNFTSYSNSAITANHVVAECVFANPFAITSNVTWTTANGSVTLNGTCTTATTVNLVLVKKDN